MSDFLILAVRPQLPPIKVCRRQNHLAAQSISKELYVQSDMQIAFKIIEPKQYWCRTCGKSDNFETPTTCHDPLTLTGKPADWYCGAVHGCWNWSAE